MKYLVMETHPAYAVVLDEEGRFLKAANLRYQVGDTVQDIVELRTPKAKSPVMRRSLVGLMGLAACFCLVFFGYYQPNFIAYGTLRIQINPDVEMTVSRTDRVLDLEGLNDDGEKLIEGYAYQGKDRETAANELVERAIDMGYLSDGDTVSITVTSADADWRTREEARIRAQMEERYGDTIVIQLGGDTQQAPPASPADGSAEVVIPVAPPDPAPADDDTDDGPAAGGVTDDGDDTDYGPDADGVTDYDDTDYGPNADGVTDYEDRNDGPYTDGVTDYEDRSDDDWDDSGDDDMDDDGQDDDSDDDSDSDDMDDDGWDGDD